jgi:Tfp pilus assembly protein PilF
MRQRSQIISTVVSPRLLLVAAVAAIGPSYVRAQEANPALIASARDRIVAGDYAKADTLLAKALASAVYVMDSVDAVVWRGVLEYQRGNMSLAQLSLRRAFKLHVPYDVPQLEAISPALARFFDSEYRAIRIFPAREVDVPAHWRIPPVFVYPAVLKPRRIAGHALVHMVVDTLGRVEERSIEILETPDSAFVAPLRETLLASQFEPARSRGRPVKSSVSYQFNLTPPGPKDPLQLVNTARAQLRRHRADSAIATIEDALDSTNGASPAIRVYAHFIQGLAWRAKGRDSLAATTFSTALADYRDLVSRGVDLAPVLRSLADSVGRLTPRRE